MAYLRLTKELSGNVYTVTGETYSFSKADDELIADFGEPLINCGGAITNGSGQNLYTLEDNEKKIKSEFPIAVSFVESDYSNLYNTYAAGTTYATGDRIVSSGIYYESLQDSNVGNTPASSPLFWVALGTAATFALTLATRFETEFDDKLTAAMTTLRAKSDTFSGEREIEI